MYNKCGGEGGDSVSLGEVLGVTGLRGIWKTTKTADSGGGNAIRLLLADPILICYKQF